MYMCNICIDFASLFGSTIWKFMMGIIIGIQMLMENLLGNIKLENLDKLGLFNDMYVICTKVVALFTLPIMRLVQQLRVMCCRIYAKVHTLGLMDKFLDICLNVVCFFVALIALFIMGIMVLVKLFMKKLRLICYSIYAAVDNIGLVLDIYNFYIKVLSLYAVIMIGFVSSYMIFVKNHVKWFEDMCDVINTGRTYQVLFNAMFYIYNEVVSFIRMFIMTIKFFIRIILGTLQFLCCSIYTGLGNLGFLFNLKPEDERARSFAITGLRLLIHRGHMKFKTNTSIVLFPLQLVCCFQTAVIIFVVLNSFCTFLWWCTTSVMNIVLQP